MYFKSCTIFNRIASVYFKYLQGIKIMIAKYSSEFRQITENGLYETGKLNILGNKYESVLNMETIYVITFFNHL